MRHRFVITPIDSLADPRIADYADVRDHELLQRTDPLDPAGHRGLFIAEGDLVVRRLLDSAYRAKSVLITPTRLHGMDDLFADSATDIAAHDVDAVPVYVVPQELMNTVVGFNIHRGILAVGIRPTPPTLDQLLDEVDLIVVLEDLTNHDNLGSIYRNLAALIGPGKAAVLLSPRCADPLYRKSLRVSMGHVLSIATLRSNGWAADLRRLKDRGFTTLALTPDPAADDLGDWICPPTPARVSGQGQGGRDGGGGLPARLALLLGAEGPGLTPPTQAVADRRLRIPMAPGVDSLNVATAGAITLFAIAAVRRGNQFPSTNV